MSASLTDDQKEMLRCNIIAIPQQVDNETGCSAYRVQVIQWEAMYRANACIRENIPFPLRPGMAEACSGECFRCGGRGKQVRADIKKGEMMAQKHDSKDNKVHHTTHIQKQAVNNTCTYLYNEQPINLYSVSEHEYEHSLMMAQCIHIQHYQAPPTQHNTLNAAALNGKWHNTAILGTFEVFNLKGGWTFLFGKLLLAAFKAIHNYKRDAIKIQDNLKVALTEQPVLHAPKYDGTSFIVTKMDAKKALEPA
ncbi:hypothetical protein HD554DRAFT_2042834 [Boletus coccyginus]|nr:hypothetical protein HD554DRAFT_2042834 [Boletus coccyginus]